MDQKDFSFQSSLGANTNWEWVPEEVESSRKMTDIGGGWGAEGSNMYKWSQYDSPPVELKHPLPDGNNVADAVQINMEQMFNKERTPRDLSENILVLNIPGLVKLQTVKDRFGACAASGIVLYWIYGSWSIYTLLLKPHYEDGHISFFPLFWYGLVSALCIMSFVRAAFGNPGRIPISAISEPPPPQDNSGVKNKEYCLRCLQSRPASAHHCSKCGQCVRGMDHHCPWINNCVGEDNRFAFVQLVMYAFLMSSTAVIFLLLNAFSWPECEACKVNVSFALRHRNDLLIVCVILSTLMMAAGCGLFGSQLCMMRHDMTTLDFYKFENELRMSGKNPWEARPVAKRPCSAAFTDHCGRGPIICWFFPCRQRVPPAGRGSSII